MMNYTMSDIVQELEDIYTDNGIAMWLISPNKSLLNERFSWMRPIDLCKTPEGREKVMNLIQEMINGHE